MAIVSWFSFIAARGGLQNYDKILEFTDTPSSPQICYFLNLGEKIPDILKSSG